MDELTDKLKIGKDKFIWTTCLTQKLTQLDSKKSKPAQNETYLKWKGIYSNIKYHFLPVFTTAPLSSSFWLLQECCHVTHYQGILARSSLMVTVAFCKKLQQKTHHIHQFEKVYGIHTIITIVKADYCFMSQLLLNILSNVTLPPYPSFFVHFKHTFVTHPTKISRFP